MRLPPVIAACATVLALSIVGCGPASVPAPGASARASARPAGAGRASPSAIAQRATRVPQPEHIVVVMLENHAYDQVIGNPKAPFVNRLAQRGALFTQSYAITHPSEPNYLALFSGSTQGVTSDACPVAFNVPNLAAELDASGKTFIGYSEGLPAIGSPVCTNGDYARKHVPWADFLNVPASVSQPFSSFPATDFNRLPTVSFVIPDLCHDMHNCSVAVGDSWLGSRLAGYASWAMTHDSLLIVTWDEDDDSGTNRIPTIIAGQQVRPGSYSERITHYNVLATIEVAYGLPRAGNSGKAGPIDYIWSS